MERTSKKRDVKRETRTNPQEEPARVYRPRTMVSKATSSSEENDTPNQNSTEAEKPAEVRRPESQEISDSERRRIRLVERFDSERSSDKPRKSRYNSDEDRDGNKSYRPRTGKTNDFNYRSEGSGYSSGTNRSESKEKRFDNNRYSDRPRRSSDSERNSTSRGRFSKNDRPDDRRDRNSSKPRFERSDDRFEKRDRFSSKPKRYEESDNATGYRPRTFQKKYTDEFTGEPKPRKEILLPEKSESRADGLIRLNKYISNSGLCSRREADEHIKNGQITVNGEVVTQLGTRVSPNDEIRFKGKELESERKVYILMNKPKDYVTTVDDPHAKQTVMDLLEGACQERVYPVGRLDRNSTGVLLLTNDGELTKKLTHPSYLKKKVYYVGLDKKVSFEDIEKIRNGIEVDGEILSVDSIDYTEDSDGTEVGVEIHTGQNRVVRRIFESLFYRVVKLDRVYFAGLTKKSLPRGKWRFLTQKEVYMLKMNRF